MSEQQRNAAADLAVCEAATPGPWQADPAFGTPWTVGGDLRNFDKCVTVCETYPEGGINCPQEDYNQGAVDARFIAMAREALPWWIAEAERLRAEPTPLARLEAWANRHDAWPKLCLFWVQLEHPNRTPPDVVAYRCPSEERDYHAKEMGTATVAAGTDEQPATLDEMILAALAKWEELYG